MQGLELIFPPTQNQHIAYPFAIHSIMQLPWNYYSEGDHFFLRATFCSKHDPPGSNRCQPCDNLRSDTTLDGIRNRIINGVNENSPLFWFPIGGLITRVRRKNDQIQALRLAKHTDTRMIASQSATIDCHKEFVMAVGSGKVTRIAPLVAASINNHESIQGLAQRIYRASADTFREGPKYNAKGFTVDKRMVGLIALRLGGARLADILHRALGLPGLTTLRKHTVIRPLRTSARMPTIEEIEENIDAYTDGEDLPSGPPEIIHQVIMLDEIAVEERLRWDDKDNMVKGTCREHSDDASLDFGDIADAEMLLQDITDGKVHMASEVSNDDAPFFFLTEFICKRRQLLPWEGCQKNPHSITRSPSAFREPVKRKRVPNRRSSCASLTLPSTMKSKLSKTSPIYPLLAPLEFMDLLVGPDDITPDKDFRHVMKTIRSLLMRKVGIDLLGFLITPAIVKQHLVAAGDTNDHVTQLLNPNDKQNVPHCYQLLKGLWDLPDALPSDTPAFIRARVALNIFGRLGYHLVMPYICISLSLREQLVHLSTAAHLLLILFTTNGASTDFMANQTFVNIMIMIKNAFFCVAKAKIDIPDSEFFLILLGTDRLEKLFGLIRTAVGTDSNVDVYQLGTRASNLTEISIILAIRPHWDRGPRRLKLRAIINEKGDVDAKADHISPASCTGNLHVKDIVLHSCWKQGRRKAESYIPGGRETLEKCALDPSFNILSPFGRLLVNVPDAEDAFEPDPKLFRPSPDEENAPAPDSFYDPAGDLEDAIAIAEPRTKNYSPHVLVDGKKVSKATILSQMTKGRSIRLSRDRTRRVARVSAFLAPTHSLITTDASFDVPTLRIGNPIAALVTCEEQIFLAVGQVNRIVLGSEDTDSVALNLLYDAGTKISFQILRLLPATKEDDSNGLHDWRWSLSLESACSNVPGIFIQPLNPTVSNRVVGSPSYLFSSEVLVHVAASINTRLVSNDLASLPDVLRTEWFPYRHAGTFYSYHYYYTLNSHPGKACFVVEPDDPDYRGKLKPQDSVECTKCDPPVPLPLKNKQLLLQHNGGHILFDPTFRRADQRCGLCLRPFPMCEFYLTGGSGTDSARQVDWKRSTCLRQVTFSMAAAQKWSESSPCTNHLIPCPLTCGLVIWTYNIEAHYRGIRHGLTSLENVHLGYNMANGEYELMKKLFENRQNYPRPRNLKATKAVPPLTISTAHSSNLAFRYHYVVFHIQFLLLILRYRFFQKY
ncbi:hypothetical protein C8J57DRAFT_1081377 [Mycena rebaudengoi]|nr:hypothetical protein C8J57DRAFT_1081377 [Mycena rebaudengoi]